MADSASLSTPREHSPLPWSTPCFDSCGKFSSHGECAGGWSIPEVEEGEHGQFMHEADAAFIVHCVNAHDALVAALKEAVRTLEIFHSLGMPEPISAAAWKIYQNSPEMKRINAAIAQAEGR